MSKKVCVAAFTEDCEEGGGQAGYGGGVSSVFQFFFAPLFFFSLRPQDVFSKGLVHLPRKGRRRFLCTKEQDIGTFVRP